MKHHTQQHTNQLVRDSNIELLRIFCMFLIVWNHLFTHGNWDESIDIYISSRVLSFGKIGVDVFVMITGWFMVNSRFKSKSLIRTIGTAAFYMISIYLVGLLGRPTGMIPILSIPWFVKTYSMLYILSPVLNLILRSFDKAHLQALLGFLIFIMSVIPSLTGNSYTGLSTGLPWFCFLYLLSGFFRLWGLPSRDKVIALYISGGVLFVLTRVADALLYTGRMNIGRISKVLTNVIDGTYIPVLMLSVAVFTTFASYKIGNNNIINKIASTTFGIYLIHDNETIRHWLWPHFQIIAENGVLLFVLESLLVSICVFTICSIIESCRLRFIEYFEYPPKMSLTIDKLDSFMN